MNDTNADTNNQIKNIVVNINTQIANINNNRLENIKIFIKKEFIFCFVVRIDLSRHELTALDNSKNNIANPLVLEECVA